MGDTTSIEIPDEMLEGADEMAPTQTEFARRMIRAGRRQWGYDHVEQPDKPHVKFDESTPSSEASKDVLAELVTRNLARDDGIREDELVELLFDDIHDEISSILEDLDDVEYKPTKGGWVKHG